MRGKPLKFSEVHRIKKLRATGHSLPEICKATGRGNSTVFALVRDIVVKEPYLSLLREKQGGSKNRSNKKWVQAAQDAQKYVGQLSPRDRLLILAALYWGEGNKKELNLINGDTKLIAVFIRCLSELGVTNDDLRVSIRTYEDLPRDKVLNFWSALTMVPVVKFRSIEILRGKRQGKLPYGMCRVRVAKSEYVFKSIMSMIESIKSQI